jgi:hypothetical protein
MMVELDTDEERLHELVRHTRGNPQGEQSNRQRWEIWEKNSVRIRQADHCIPSRRKQEGFT